MSIEKESVESKEVHDQVKEEDNAKSLYELMEEMAATGAFQSIKDPVAWQRETRKDKPLYGRGE